MTTTQLSTVDVLVVGAGPAGLATAISAARDGARVLLVERHPGTTRYPRAIGVDVRTMEIFRSWGLHRRIRQGEIPVRALTSTSPTVREADPVGTPIGYPLDPRAALAVSPVLPSCCPQDHIEPILLAHARSLGVDVRFSVELTGFVDDAAGVHAQLLDRDSGAVTQVHARFAVGADGPRSTVRQVLGIPFDRLGSLGPHVNIMFRADLDPVLGDRRYPLYFLGETGRPNVVFPLGRRRWGYLRPADVPLDDLQAVVRAAIGVPTLDVQIIAGLQVELAGELARSFRSGNVFLVGDAAHRMSPRGAVGMNTAIHGAHNLGWKLAWVTRGRAGAALLDSYQAERRPPAEHNTRHSVELDRPAPPDRIAATLGTRYTSHVVATGPAVDPAAPAAPGTRAPHVWIRHEGRARSTLDVFDGALTLLVGDRAPHWRTATAGCPTPVQVLGVDEQHGPASERLRAAYRLENGDAVLVRPDGYIASRLDRTAEPAVALHAALTLALGLPPAHEMAA
jgi:2-polyprenyl-6-methoxyphenol hydroxylase-like FAD-dependent oxidoreductase